MCGFVGLLGAQRSEDERRAVVSSMVDRIVHRGPDGRGEYLDTEFSLAHVRLSIIDLEGGQQPMQSPDGRFVLAYNGEIYNFLELRQALIQAGERFQTFSDTEVLLKLLIRDGVDALDQLNGMFAFIFIDTHAQRWLAARDPFGIKPLYWTKVGSELMVASEIKALLIHPGVERRMNWDALQEYLTFQYCLEDRTLFDNIYRLEPGCYMHGKQGRCEQIKRYWDMAYAIDDVHTEAWFIDELQSLLEDSARLQIRSDVPLGAYLSGGMDSSLVASLAARHRADAIPMFHGRFAEGARYDESHYAKLLAERIDSPIHVEVPTAEQFVEWMPYLIYMLDEPLAGPGLFPQYAISRVAAKHVKVVLGGQGGDEIFGGYSRYLIGYLEQALKGAIFETQEEGRHLVTLQSIIPNLPMLQGYEPLIRKFWSRGLFEPMDARYYHLIDRSPDLASLLTVEAGDRINREQVFESFRAIFNHPDTRSYFNKMTHFDQKTFLPALLQVEDRVSMAVSLEARVPILDKRIPELVCRMPPPLKFAGGRSKHVLKRAAELFLPTEIINRKDKMGFPVPLAEWLRGGPVRDFVGDTLLGSASRQRGIFKPDQMEDLVVGERPFGRQLWGALSLELWFQQVIDDTSN